MLSAKPSSSKAQPSAQLILDPVLRLILGLPSRLPAPQAPRRLAALFRELQDDELRRPADDIEDLIWALWISHENEAAEEVMMAAVEALASGALDQARKLLDHLVLHYPDWSEAWNKRATLAFIEKRDAESLKDIGRTLELEPRHFGAVSGFGQICLRHGHLNEARAAFQMALTINPHLRGLREMIRDLSPRKLMLH
jgi:tetratricopeptide (TPR) repeat protein